MFVLILSDIFFAFERLWNKSKLDLYSDAINSININKVKYLSFSEVLVVWSLSIFQSVDFKYFNLSKWHLY